MDLKTGRASSWKKEKGGGAYSTPDTKLSVIEFNGTITVNSNTSWMVKSYGEASGAFNTTFGSGSETNPTLTQNNGQNVVGNATFNTFGNSVTIDSASMCSSKQGGAADSSVDLAIVYLDCRKVLDTTIGGEDVPGTAFGSLGVKYASTFLAKKEGMKSPSSAAIFACHDMNSVFKGLTIPEGCLVFVCLKDNTGGTGNAVGVNGSITLRLL